MTNATPQIFEPDGRAIPFADEGEGPVKVVLLPARGFGISSLETLAHVLVEEGFHIVRIGVRSAADGVTMHDLATDVADVLEGIGMSSAFLGGHGFGGALARTVALDHHDRAEGVLLLGVLDADAAAPTDDAAALGGAAVDPAVSARLVERHGDAAAAAVQDAALAATPAEEWATLAANLPILVIQGTADEVTPLAAAERLQASSPERVSMTRVEGGGHLFVLTHAGEVGFGIEDYLAWD
jgi:pimeloyl-ACP methyl ester carboxylesterase